LIGLSLHRSTFGHLIVEEMAVGHFDSERSVDVKRVVRSAPYVILDEPLERARPIVVADCRIGREQDVAQIGP
jgi:ABC-type lipopolysaccharide export system ATPase subunit